MGSILGNRVVRVEDPRLLTVGGTYVEDIELADAAWVAYVRSPYAHARIIDIDTSDAAAAPGVVAVFTSADLSPLGLVPHPSPAFPDAMRRPFLAIDTVRYVGEPVVAVVADDRLAGRRRRRPRARRLRAAARRRRPRGGAAGRGRCCSPSTARTP